MWDVFSHIKAGSLFTTVTEVLDAMLCYTQGDNVSCLQHVKFSLPHKFSYITCFRITQHAITNPYSTCTINPPLKLEYRQIGNKPVGQLPPCIIL